MEHTWNIQIWGTRGSFPAVGADFLEYGGNTSCLSVDFGDALVVLDAGSGLASLGDALAGQGRKRADIFLSHLHLDHVMGLFPFVPRYAPAFQLHLYGMPGLAEVLPRLIGPPLWPVSLANGQGQIYIHEVSAGTPFPLDGGAAPGLTMTALEGNHPGGCGYYRLEREGRRLVYALDCELAGDTASRLAAFAQGADLLVWDASFAPGDLKPGWGHSTWEQGIALGREAGVKRVLMTHYSADYTDEFLRGQEALACQAGELGCFAREGMVIQL